MRYLKSLGIAAGALAAAAVLAVSAVASGQSAA